MKKKTLDLGASGNPSRYSNIAINRLVNYGHEVVGVGLRQATVAGVSIQTGMPHLDDIDTITLYLNPQNQRQYYHYILSLSPRRVIFNPGTENPELYRMLREKNIEIDPACTLVMLATNQY